MYIPSIIFLVILSFPSRVHNVFAYRYPGVSKEEFVKACPVCCNNCNCKACLRRFSPKDYSCSETNKIKYSQQILQQVFPLVTTLYEDQLKEKEIEAKLKGVSIPELQLQDADVFCDKCGSYFFDLYRSCACGYVLCLVCCRELRDGQLKGVSSGSKARIDGSIPCPPKDIGGCNDGTLELKHIMRVKWIENLLQKAQGVYKMNLSYDRPQTCSMEVNGNELCSLSAKDIQPQHMQRFQSHWSKGEPIIVNDVLSTSSGLSWEPMVLWRAFRDMKKSSNHSHAYEVRAINCLDWSEVTLNLSKFCSGYSAGQFKQGLPLILKLEDWKPSCLSDGEWPRHFVEFINCLPFKDYTNPDNGYLNMAVKLPDLSLKPDMGPKMDIAYGVEEEMEYGDSVTKLRYEKADTVNVLTHTRSYVLKTKLNTTKIVKQEHGDQHEPLVREAGPKRNEGHQYGVDPMEGGALWDVYRREDVPKLEDYLRSHSTEFRHKGCRSVEQVFHPIHDRTFYLNTKHKRKLKEEFGIEPWTFKQKLGDAVFIPAGCPYQLRNLKIGKIMIHALDNAVAEMSRFTGSKDDVQDQIAMATEILNEGDVMNINNPINDGIRDSNSQDNSSVFPALSSSVNDTVDHKPAAIETSEDVVGMWQGNVVGKEAKKMLEAVKDRYPDTFSLEIRSTPYWLSILEGLHLFVKGFLETHVDALSEDQMTSLEAGLNDFERFGFHLSWARKRLDMVKILKFGNDPLRLELVCLEESLTLLRKEVMDATARLEKARLDYDSAREACNKKANEMALRFGVDYDDVLNGNLGFDTSLTRVAITMVNKDFEFDRSTSKKPVQELDLNQNSSKRRKKETFNKQQQINGVDQPKSCHQCHRSDKQRVLHCTKCKSKRYCIDCITKWYPGVSEEEFVKACPACRNTCNCKQCFRRFSPTKFMQAYSCSQSNKIKYSKHILQKLFPLLTTMHQEQMMEKEIEAKLKGVSISELQLQDAECEVDDDIFCDNCGSYTCDFYRSCACGYDLCLLCCRELRNGQLKGMTYRWKAHIDGSIPCLPKDMGGCNDGTLELKRIMRVNWVVNLLDRAQGLYKMNFGYDNPESCMQFSGDHLYCLSAKDIQPQYMQRFQYHWSKGEPIIVSDVLSASSGLSWEPMVLWRAFRDIKKSSNNAHAYEVHAINCLDWSEVIVDLGKFFSGYSAGQYKQRGMSLILKLEDWQPSCSGEWPRHFVEFVNCLPFQDYTNPVNGYLNVAVRLPDLSLKPDMGPKMDIAYGVEEEMEYGDSVTKLHYEKSDTVNVLTHTKAGDLTSTKLNKRNIVKQKHGDQHEALVCEASPQRTKGQQYADNPTEAGALWDVFQRHDVPKLEEYMRNCSAEFRHTNCLSDGQVFHPIHDRTFYLNMEHKRKLKEKFGIEPWSFKQKLGDAVFIPAGCPYQVRNLKSCTKVELNFVSPESIGECIRLHNELRMLPNNHRAKRQKLNIGKMMIYALDHAVTDLSGRSNSNGPTDDIQDQLATVPEILNCDDMNVNNHSNGWVCDSESESSVFPDQTAEDSGSSEEAAGSWHGNVVGEAAKQMLEAIEYYYPNTFQRLHIRSKPHWLSILKELHVFFEGFLETSVDALTEDQMTNLEVDLNDFERLGFDLSWARKRLDMVKNLKFGNDPLRLELVGLEESLTLLHKEVMDATVRLEKAQLEYAKARDARNMKAHEMALRFGAEYEDVLNGNLGFAMLPGY
ncbi:hypothetical protein QVD17_14726 [Tagetes erecta]|uniref:Uncharacterized protein n=1 Tax=Tagetes erecta TaxID=13708 RepID=A0AAD8KNH0_TARER|nr:hypothetical protein QVD17_14726 [Tagetes erecta]